MSSKKRAKQKLRLSMDRDMLKEISSAGQGLTGDNVDSLDQIAPGLKEKKGVNYLNFIEDASVKRQFQNVVKLLENDHPSTKGLWEKMVYGSAKSDFNAVLQCLISIQENLSRDYDPAVIARDKAEQFAIQMGKHLEAVRSEGTTSMRDIADRFNQMGVNSFYNKSWSHTTVMKLIHRRRDMGLE